MEAEWRTGPGDTGVDPTRCGEPYNKLFSEHYQVGTKFIGKTSAQRRIATINFFNSINNRDRSLMHAYNDIVQASNFLRIPDNITKDAKHLYKQFNDSGRLTRGNVRTAIKANSLMDACRRAGVARTTDEIAEAFNISSRDLSKHTKVYREVMGDMGGDIISATNIFPRMLKHMELEEKTRRLVTCKANKIYERIIENPELMGRSPNSIAATILIHCLTGMKGLTRQTLCKEFSISNPTVKKIEQFI